MPPGEKPMSLSKNAFLLLSLSLALGFASSGAHASASKKISFETFASDIQGDLADFTGNDGCSFSVTQSKGGLLIEVASEDSGQADYQLDASAEIKESTQVNDGTITVYHLPGGATLKLTLAADAYNSVTLNDGTNTATCEIDF